MFYDEDTILYLDGKFMKACEAGTDLYSQTLHYGIGVFEGLRAYRTVHGTKIFRAQDHFQRLIRSCAALDLPIGYTAEELTQISYQLIEQNGLSCAYIRPLVFCPPQMTLGSPATTSIMIAVWKWGSYFGDQTLRACISRTTRNHPAACLMEAKVTGQYVNATLAANEAKKRGFDESIMPDEDGFVAQAPGANFFYERDGALFTAPAGHIFPGITRKTVMEICHHLDIPVFEKKFRPEELFDADAAFFCGTATEITPVISVENHPMGRPWNRSLSHTIQETYKSLVLDKSYSFTIV